MEGLTPPAADLGFPALPEDLIAQTPLAERDAARLLVVDRSTGRLDHRVFRDLPDWLAPGDALVLNDVRVAPVRLRGRKGTGGKIQFLLLARFPGGDARGVPAPLVHRRHRHGADLRLWRRFIPFGAAGRRQHCAVR